MTKGVHNGWKDNEIDAYSTGPIARPLTRLLALLTHLLAPHYSLFSRALMRSFVRSLARSPTRSQAHGNKSHVRKIERALISFGFNPSWSGITLVTYFDRCCALMMIMMMMTTTKMVMMIDECLISTF